MSSLIQAQQDSSNNISEITVYINTIQNLVNTWKLENKQHAYYVQIVTFKNQLT